MVYTSRKINHIYTKVYPILKRIEMNVQKYCDKDSKFETFYMSIRKVDTNIELYGGKK